MFIISWRASCTSFLFEFIELLDSELNIFFALIFKDVQFFNLTLCFRLGKIKSDQVKTDDTTKLFSELFYQFPGILQRLHRALKPGGIFHIAMKLGDGASRDKFDRLYTYYSQAALQRHLSDAGFTIIETTLGEDLGLAGDVEPWIALVCTPLSPSTA